MLCEIVVIPCFCVQSENEIQCFEWGPENVGDHAGCENFPHLEMQVVVEEPIFFYFLFLFQIYFYIFVVLFQMQKLIIIEKENGLFSEKIYHELLKSSYVYSEINIAMKLCLEQSVIHIGNGINFDPDVNGDHEQQGLLVLVSVESLVGAAR